MDAAVNEFGTRRIETPIKEKFEEFVKLLAEDAHAEGFGFLGTRLGVIFNELIEGEYDGQCSGDFLSTVGENLIDGYANREEHPRDKTILPGSSAAWNSPLTPERKEFISKISLVMAENERRAGKMRLMEYLQEFAWRINEGEFDEYSCGETVAVISHFYFTNSVLLEGVEEVETKEKLEQTNNIKVEGYGCYFGGRFYVIDSRIVRGEYVYLLESESFGDDAPALLVNARLQVLDDEVWSGIDEAISLLPEDLPILR